MRARERGWGVDDVNPDGSLCQCWYYLRERCLQFGTLSEYRLDLPGQLEEQILHRHQFAVKGGPVVTMFYEYNKHFHHPRILVLVYHNCETQVFQCSSCSGSHGTLV